MIDAQLLVVDNTSNTYRFRHPLLGEVVYSDLLPPQRARLHGRIAESLQQQSPDALRRADRAGELAFHLDRSGDTEGAFFALLAAADAAETLAPAAAFGHLERAFELWDAVGERVRARSAEATGCGKPPNWRRTPSATIEQSRSLGPHWKPVPHRSARRSATNGSAVTCGPADNSTRAVSSSSGQQSC